MPGTACRDRIERQPHRPHVVGRRPAAAADDPRARHDHPRRDIAEVRRARRHTRTAPRCAAASPALGMIEQRAIRCRRGHPLQGVETRDRPGAAVHADDIGARRPRAPAPPPRASSRRPARHPRRTSSRRSTGRSDVPRATSSAISRDGRSENVSSTTTSMPPSSRPSSCSRNAARASASRSRASSGPIGRQRPHRAAHERVAPGHLARLPRELRRAPIEPRTLCSARPNGARRNRFAPRVTVSMSSAPASRYSRWVAVDELRPGRGQLVERCPLGHATTEQERAHRAVGEERPSGETSGEALARRHRRAGRHLRPPRRRRGSVPASAPPPRAACPCAGRRPRAGHARSARRRSSGSADATGRSPTRMRRAASRTTP